MTLVREAILGHQQVASTLRPGERHGSPRAPDQGVKRQRRGLLHRIASEGGVVSVMCLTLYIAVAWLLEMHYYVFPDDAVSRMANGFYVLYSRDPHLAAIGFVWNPLPSISVMPLLLLKSLWTPLTSHNMAGALTSAVLMTAAIHQMRCTLREWGVNRLTRLTIIAVFALNPMIIYYAGNGMSEALYTFTLLAITRYLTRWLIKDDLRSLVYAGTALGFAYLARNEAVGPAVLSSVLVAAVCFSRRGGLLKHRFMTALTETTIYVLPFVVSFAAWAVASWVITGAPFAQFSSVYGTTSEINALGIKKLRLSATLNFEVHAIVSLAPLLVAILFLVLVVSLRRREPFALVPIAILGGSLGFDMAAYVTGSIISSYRYFIEALPLSVMLVGSLFATAHSTRVTTSTPNDAQRGVKVRTQERGVRTKWAAGLVAVATSAFALVLLAPGIATTGAAMFNPKIGSDESAYLGYVFHKHLSQEDRVYKDHFAEILSIGSYITKMNLPDGSVVVDTFDSCAPEVITSIKNPRVFVITNDRDFQAVLADPPQFRSHYMLVPDPKASEGDLNAINRAYPDLYHSGQTRSSSFKATLVHSFPQRGNCEALRLYRVSADYGPAASSQ